MLLLPRASVGSGVVRQQGHIFFLVSDAGAPLSCHTPLLLPRPHPDPTPCPCPSPSPQTCNRVTGLLSPDPDAHTLRGALVYGSGKSDAFQVRGGRAEPGGAQQNQAVRVGRRALWAACTRVPLLATNPIHPGTLVVLQDDRWADSNRVGIENNAGLAALLAGVAEVGGR